MSKNTKPTILAAFDEILHKKQFNKITVKDITDVCGISRMTFYYHFDDIYDLMNKSIIEKIKSAISTNIRYENWREEYISIFKNLLEHRSYFAKVTPHADFTSVERHLCESASDIIDNIVDEVAYRHGLKISEHNKEFLVSFYAFSMSGFLLKWLAGGMKEVPEDFITRLCVLLEGTFEHTLRKAAAAE